MALNNLTLKEFSRTELIKFRNISVTDLLSTSKLADILIEEGWCFDKKVIEGWHSFEKGLEYFTDTQIMYMLYFSLTGKSPLFLLTDEAIKEKIIYKFPTSSEFLLFSQEYEKKYQMEFFQPADYIVICPDELKINIVHHDGMLFSFYTPNNNFLFA